MAKRSTVDLVEDDEEEDQTRQCSRWTHEEEILVCKCWIEHSENSDIGADRNEDPFWRQIMQDFNNSTIHGTRTKNMLTDHAWCILKNHSKWDAPQPLDTDDHTEIFEPGVRPRPVGKTRPAIKTKSETTGSIVGSASGSISDSLSEDLRHKLQAASSAYEAKKEKELAYTKCTELEFLMIDPDSLPEPKASIIRKKQEKIMAKYNQEWSGNILVLYLSAQMAWQSHAMTPDALTTIYCSN
ncbi:hypothetical protein Tco_1375338 [Tanacetum coccineum]